MNSLKIRSACVFYNNILAGYLLQNSRGYTFLYDSNYAVSQNPSIALDMPKKKRLFRLPYHTDFKYSGFIPLYFVRPPFLYYNGIRIKRDNND